MNRDTERPRTDQQGDELAGRFALRRGRGVKDGNCRGDSGFEKRTGFSSVRGLPRPQAAEATYCKLGFRSQFSKNTKKHAEQKRTISSTIGTKTNNMRKRWILELGNFSWSRMTKDVW